MAVHLKTTERHLPYDSNPNGSRTHDLLTQNPLAIQYRYSVYNITQQLIKTNKFGNIELTDSCTVCSSALFKNISKHKAIFKLFYFLLCAKFPVGLYRILYSCIFNMSIVLDIYVLSRLRCFTALYSIQSFGCNTNQACGHPLKAIVL